jgi:hypothetical protein
MWHIRIWSAGTFTMQVIESIDIYREGDIWTINMRNHLNQIVKEFSEFRIGMENQIGGQPSPSFLVTYESDKLSTVETVLDPRRQSLQQQRWVWEITGEELIMKYTASGFVTVDLHYKRV